MQEKHTDYNTKICSSSLKTNSNLWRTRKNRFTIAGSGTKSWDHGLLLIQWLLNNSDLYLFSNIRDETAATDVSLNKRKWLRKVLYWNSISILFWPYSMLLIKINCCDITACSQCTVEKSVCKYKINWWHQSCGHNCKSRNKLSKSVWSLKINVTSEVMNYEVRVTSETKMNQFTQLSYEIQLNPHTLLFSIQIPHEIRLQKVPKFLEHWGLIIFPFLFHEESKLIRNTEDAKYT